MILGLLNIKIGSRLAFSFGIVLVITAIISAIGVWRLQELENVTQQLTQIDNERVKATSDWRQTVEMNWVRTRAAVMTTDKHHFDALLAEIEKTSQATNSARSIVERLIRTDAGRALVVSIDKAREAY